MPTYSDFSQDAEILGRPMLGLLENLTQESIRPILEEHNLIEIEPDRWYPMNTWVSVFMDLIERYNGASTELVSAGMAAIDKAALPPDINSIPYIAVVQGANDVYLMNIRGTDVGYMNCEVITPQHVILRCRTPYPDDFVYGNFYAGARRFLPKGTQFTVSYDENNLRRDQGGEETLYHIEWGD